MWPQNIHGDHERVHAKTRITHKTNSHNLSHLLRVAPLHKLICRLIDVMVRLFWRMVYLLQHAIRYNRGMQKIATRVFIYSSIAFGVVGMAIVLTSGGPNTPDTPLTESLIRLLFATVFVILPSFALSVAGKYLGGKF